MMKKRASCGASLIERELGPIIRSALKCSPTSDDGTLPALTYTISMGAGEPVASNDMVSSVAHYVPPSGTDYICFKPTATYLCSFSPTNFLLIILTSAHFLRVTHSNNLLTTSKLPLQDIVRGILPQMAHILAEIAHRHTVEKHLVEFFQRATFHLWHEKEEEYDAGEVRAGPDVAVFCALDEFLSDDRDIEVESNLRRLTNPNSAGLMKYGEQKLTSHASK
jgi:hypothetical protein